MAAGTTRPQGSADGRSPPCQPPPCPQAGPQLRTPILVRSTISTQPQVCMHLSCLGHAFVPLMSRQKLERESACLYVCHHCQSDCLDTCLYVDLCVCACLSLVVLPTATSQLPTQHQGSASAMTAGQTQWHKPGDPSLAPSTTAAAPADSAAFIPADAFSGPRAGYVYKQGTQGTGYYKDHGPMALSGTCMLFL